MTDWRTDFELLANLTRRMSPNHQEQWRTDPEAARKDDIKNKRGHLIINPDLEVGDLDLEGCIVVRPGEDEGGEYRIIIDQALKGVRNMETGEIRAGYWLRHQPPLQILPIVQFPPGVGSGMYDITERIHEQHSKMAKITPKLEPMAMPTSALFDEEWANPEPEVFIGPRKQVVVDSVKFGVEDKNKNRFDPKTILASQAKKDLVIEIENAMYRRCHKAWMDYYEAAENLDRIHPHFPARKGFREVTTAGVNKSKGYHEALKLLKIECDKQIHDAKPEILKEARKHADHQFSKELEHCECDMCRKARQ